MRLKKLITELIKSNQELAKALDVKKIKKYDELVNNLNQIPHFKVKTTRMVIDDKTGRVGMEIIYEYPKTIIWLNDDNSKEVPESFKSMNELNLLSVKECEKIRKGMEDIKNENLR